MANYQKLLSRAVDALPDNSGASRREVYEKARKALVTQLRAISPPLPAREITKHRLELEDCIRQVEYDATETLLGSLKDLDEETIAIEAQDMAQTVPAPLPEAEKTPQPDQPTEIDNIIAQAEQAEKVQREASVPAPASPVSENMSALDADDDDMEAQPKTVTQTLEVESGQETSIEPPAGASVSALEHQLESSMVSGPQSSSPEDSSPEDFTDQELADQESDDQGSDGQEFDDQESGDQKEEEKVFAPDDQIGGVSSATNAKKAMSRVREVELDNPSQQEPSLPQAEKAAQNGQQDVTKKQDVAQKVVDRAIEVLDREARGEHVPIEEIELDEDGFGGKNGGADPDETRFGAGGDEEKGGNALTIFLVLAIVLLASVGGGGYWAWREGYVDLDALFAASAPAPTLDTASSAASKPDPQGKILEADAPGPGNTATDNNIATPSEKLVGTDSTAKPQDQMTPANANTPNGGVTTTEMTTAPTLPSATTKTTTPVPTTDGVRVIDTTPGANTATDANKSEERLTTSPMASEPTLTTDNGQTNDTVASGTQSLLLEASADGATGAVPFSGTVKWSRGMDEMGQPTLIGTANIPARNLGVKVLIRRNADPTLPASHLMEIDFTVTPTFVGGAVAGLPGILLKNEELVQGTALIGASARVVGNSFLFALSAAEQDVRTNINLLKTRKWMDLAIIYATGRRAIITLEKDAAAQKMFEEVLATWQSEAEAQAAKASAPGNSG